MIRIRCYYKGSSNIKTLNIQPSYVLYGGFRQAGQRPCSIHVFWVGQDTVDTMTNRDIEALTKTVVYALGCVKAPDGDLLLSPELQTKLGFTQ